jgi:hypothetical protein
MIFQDLPKYILGKSSICPNSHIALNRQLRSDGYCTIITIVEGTEYLLYTIAIRPNDTRVKELCMLSRHTIIQRMKRQIDTVVAYLSRFKNNRQEYATFTAH